MEIKKSPILDNKYICNLCNYITSYKRDYENHILTLKHKKRDKGNYLEIQKSPNDFEKFHCMKCNYTTMKKSEYEKHENTIKHRRLNNELCKDVHKVCNNCNKHFINASGLWKHRKKCTYSCNEQINSNLSNEHNKIISSKIFIEFIKQSKDIQQFLIEQNKELQNTFMEKTSEFQNTVIEQNNKIIELSKNQSVIHNTTNNTTNNQFNLQVFLNETCKDAMNITDFINSLQLTTKDFENTGKVGFIEGITQIFINRLNNVDTTKRPLHCTDAKRETLYIKDDNVWNKDSEDKTKFKKVVNQIANKNLQQLNKWKEEHPDCITLDSKDNIEYRKYYKAALGGASNEEDEKFFEKIKRNVLKEIVVDKSV